MKIENLMIGDWVYLMNTIHNVSFPENGVIQDEGYTTTLTPIKITTISENCASYYSNKLESYITLSSEEIEPIQLTTEILEKNGFRDTSFEQHKQQHYIVDTSEHILHYHTNLNSCSVYKKKEVLCCFLQNNVQYVHELQHALKLCGIDKEIII